ncbi:hypothetical protein BDZ89DRAFT_1012890 [Hymenopellis radicata]|nr:hypothetical protein BDZ89DRAFT_1012890 [Hymenopellis radicata]
MPSQYPDWFERLKNATDPGVDSIQAGIEQRKTDTQVAKLRCTNCGKEEHGRKPLQSCSQCRSVRYCDRNCQVVHYRASHKVDCAAFKVPPLCRAFSVDVRPHGIYPEHPIFAQGHARNGVGAWVSIAGQVDARLSHLPGDSIPSDIDDMTPENTLNALPGTSGDLLGLVILVQNRQNPKTPIKVVVHAADILAVTTPRGSDILSQGRKPGEKISTIEDPDTGRSLGVLSAKYVITHINGREIKNAEKKHPFIVDPKTCSVSLGPGDYAIFHVDYRVGGPRVERDYQALERLSYFEIPYSDGDGVKCKFQTKMDTRILSAILERRERTWPLLVYKLCPGISE